MFDILELTNCKYFISTEWSYNVSIDLRTLSNVRPPGYIVRIPLNIIGDHDANIVLSTVAQPQENVPVAYEFGKFMTIASVECPKEKILNFPALDAIDGSNKICDIRKGISSNSPPWKRVLSTPFINLTRPTKVLIEISEGEIFSPVSNYCFLSTAPVFRGSNKRFHQWQ